MWCKRCLLFANRPSRRVRHHYGHTSQRKASMAQSFCVVLIRYNMEIQQNKTISIRYWFTWGLSSAIGVWMLLSSLGGPHLCSPVVGCVVESIMFVAIIVSIILLVIRVFKKNKLKLVTPLILIVFFTPSTFFYLLYTV